MALLPQNIMPQGNQLQNLLRMVSMVGQQAQQGPQTVNIAGNNIPVRRNGLAQFAQGAGQFANNMMGLQQVQKRDQFLKSVQGITQSQKTPDEKVNDLIGLQAQYGTDYGLGIGDIVKAYQSQPKPLTVPEGFKVKSLNSSGTATFEPNVGDVENLSAQQQIQARSLARKIVGARRQNDILPAITKRMAEGATIDKIEDELRYAGQSTEFTGPIRNAAQAVLINSTTDKAQNAMDYIDDKLSSGDIEGAKTTLKRLARSNAGTDESKTITGKERTIKLLDEIQGDINNLEAQGINTNLFSGTAEQVAKKIGKVREPGLRKLATKIQSAIQSYRRSMSGVAFSVPESREYADMFPSISRTGQFNSANIQALKDVFGGDLDNFYSMSMGEDAYKSLFSNGIEEGHSVVPESQGMAPKAQNVLTATNPQTGQKIQSIDGGNTWQKM